MRKILISALYGASALGGIAAFAGPAWAQAADQTGAAVPPAREPVLDQENAAEITVTARRRDESIVDVPLAISVVTSEKLEKLDLRTTSDLANFVPGLQFSDFTPGDSRNDRGRARPLVFRGINVGAGGSVTAAGGLFLDGAAVVGNEVPAGMDIGAVEVLRGPQSVYFGRSTMTGAVSYRTKAIPQEWRGEAEVTIGERDLKRFEASVAGPVVKDLLGIRITGLSDSTDGYVTNDFNNGAGDKLGARSRRSLSGTVDFTPTSTIEIKGYANYFRDDDGPAQTTFIPAPIASNCIQPGATRRTVCGKIPNRRNSINYLNTVIPANSANVIFNSPLIDGANFDRQVGLQREAFNSHIVANWELSDYLKLQSVSGYHTNVTITAQDGIGQPVQPSFPYSAYFYTLTNKTRDLSTELRLSSDPERAFSWTAGANYIDAYDKVQAYVTFQDQVNGANTTFRAIPQSLGTNAAKTYGFFGGGYLKLLDKRLTLSAEGRYQIDKRRQRQQNGTTFAQILVPELAKDFKSFNPRVSIDYDVGGNRKVYTSYASGTRPGGFNSLLLTYFRAPTPNPVVIQQIATLLGVTDESYDEEKLKIYEVGFKGNFAGTRGFFDLNAYVGKLNNQQVGQGAVIPALGFTVTATTNVGVTKIHGIEFQGNYNFSRALSLNTTFAWNHARRTTFINQGGLAQFGTTNLSGNKSTNVPEFSGSTILSYTRPLSDQWNFFSTTSYVYRGKQYTDAANLSYIEGRSQVDLRAGVSDDRYTIEGFVLNVLDDRKYTSGGVQADFGQTAPLQSFHAFFGGVAPPRQFGVRFRAKI